MHPSDIKDGKIELIADTDGLLKINREALVAVNSLGEKMIASRHGDFPVRAGDKLAGTRIIQLIIEKEKMERAKEAGGTEPIFTIKPYKKKKYAIRSVRSFGRNWQLFHPKKSVRSMWMMRRHIFWKLFKSRSRQAQT